jgi:DNA-binding MarR family transcriptional regulator
MQSLHNATDSKALQHATSVAEVALLVTRFVRAQAIKLHPAGMTLGQFRALAFLSATPDCAPSELAEHLMITRPAATRLIEQLVKNGLVTRQSHSEDRRRQQLSVTAEGKTRLDAYYATTRGLIAQRLARLAPHDRDAVQAAFELVRPLFESGASTDLTMP